MTTENRRFITLDEVSAIQYRCKKCGTTVTVPRESWGPSPVQCANPGCLDQNGMRNFLIAKDSKESAGIVEFQNIVKFLSDPKGLQCVIAVELKSED